MCFHFHAVSCQVYIPLFTAQRTKARAGNQNQEESPLKEISEEAEDASQVNPSRPFMLRDDLLSRTHKFLGVVTSTLLKLQIAGLFCWIYQLIIIFNLLVCEY